MCLGRVIMLIAYQWRYNVFQCLFQPIIFCDSSNKLLANIKDLQLSVVSCNVCQNTDRTFENIFSFVICSFDSKHCAKLFKKCSQTFTFTQSSVKRQFSHLCLIIHINAFDTAHRYTYSLSFQFSIL